MKRLLLFSVMLVLMVFLTSCSRRSRVDNSVREPSELQSDIQSIDQRPALPIGLPAAPVSKPSTIKIFIENSGSMNGYINDDSEFQTAIKKMVVLLKHYYGDNSLQLYYVNKNTYKQAIPAGVSPEDFVDKMLDKSSFTGANSGEHGNTNLNDIIGLVLDETDDDCVSILISDYIYSVGNTKVASVALAGCGVETMGHFLDKSKKLPSLSTLIIQLASTFRGNYWDYVNPNSHPHRLNCKRPYYMCVVGSAPVVDDFFSHIKVDEMDGFKEKLLLSTVNLSETRYAVLSALGRKGKFVVRGQDKKEIANADFTKHGGEFQFAVGMDLSEFPLTESEKENISNYCITNGKYEIVRVEPIDPYSVTYPSDKQSIRDNNLTHMAIIRATGLPIVDCSIKINMELPSWVSSDSSIDDRSIDTDIDEQSKTFGIEYFIKGIFEAYSEVSNGDNGYLVMNIKINR
ncbi:MAG: hypothetical protein IJJ72_06590 [Bacteroidales bacterium]|nr:hypothetical protein [Bacteroidales bacterium]